MKVKVTMETVLTVDKNELEVLKKSDAQTIAQTAILQSAPVEISFAKVRHSDKED